MKLKNAFTIAAFALASFVAPALAQQPNGDVVSHGNNSWIFHTPDDGRTTLYIAPGLLTSDGERDWDWSSQFAFDANGDFNVQAGSLNVTKGNVNVSTGSVSLTSGNINVEAGNINLSKGGITAPNGTVIAYRLAGQLSNPSSRALKQDIVPITKSQAKSILSQLEPVAFAYIADPAKEVHYGFIAEDTPTPISTADGKAVNPINTIAVLTRVAKDQAQEIAHLRAELNEIKALIEAQKHN